jgi:hypothetical protein
MTGNEITVCIAAHPPRARNGMLDRAVASVNRQTLLPHRLVIQMDHNREGGDVTHSKMLEGLTTPWVAFLDSDDELHPQHLERLLATALETDADLVYPWFDVVGGTDPLGMFGQPFDGDRMVNSNYIPVTVLARTDLVQQVGGFEALHSEAKCEDWGLWIKLYRAGAKFVHLPERTWIWHHHRNNTSSNPNRGDARR